MARLKVRELCKTTNKFTGQVRYLVSLNGGKFQRIGIDTYQMLENDAVRTDCFHSKSCATYVRQYKSCYFK